MRTAASVMTEIIAFAAVGQDPRIDGGPINARVCVAHRRDGCNWSTCFQGEPTSQVLWPRLLKEVGDHLDNCPTIRREVRQ